MKPIYLIMSNSGSDERVNQTVHQCVALTRCTGRWRSPDSRPMRRTARTGRPGGRCAGTATRTGRQNGCADKDIYRIMIVMKICVWWFELNHTFPIFVHSIEWVIEFSNSRNGHGKALQLRVETLFRIRMYALRLWTVLQRIFESICTRVWSDIFGRIYAFRSNTVRTWLIESIWETFRAGRFVYILKTIYCVT